MLGVGDPDETGSTTGRFHGNPGVRVVGCQPGRRVVKIIVERDLLSAAVVNREVGVQRRTETAGKNLGGQRPATSRIDPEIVDVAGSIDRSIDETRNIDSVQGTETIVVLPFVHLRNIVHQEWNGIGNRVLAGSLDPNNAGLIGKRVALDRALAQVSARQGQVHRAPGLPAQRGNSGEERQFAHSDSIDEILSSPVDRIMNPDAIIPVPGDLVEKHGVGIEAVVVGKGEFVSIRVQQGDHRLEPAGNGISQVGNEIARLKSDHHLVTFVGLEVKFIDISRHDAPVHRGRRKNGPLCIDGRLLRIGLRSDSDISGQIKGPRFRFISFGQFPDHEAHGIAESRGGEQAAIAKAGLGIRRHFDANANGFTNLRVELSFGIAALAGVLIDLPDHFLAEFGFGQEPIELDSHTGRRQILVLLQFHECWFQFSQLVAVVADHGSRWQPVVLSDDHFDPFARDDEVERFTETLPADFGFENAAGFSAGRVNVSDSRNGRYGGHEDRRRHCRNGDPEKWRPKGWNERGFHRSQCRQINSLS